MTLTIGEIMAQEEAKKNGHYNPLRGANVWFTEDAVIDEAASTKEGRAVYKTVYIFNVQWPGKEHTARRVTDEDKIQYKDKWEAFMGGRDQNIEGTPLSFWPPMPKAVVEEFRHYKIFTVEQLAELTDDVKRKIGPLVQWNKKASKWMKAATSKQSEVVALREQLERQTQRADRLEEKIGLLLQRIDTTEGNNFSESFKLSNGSI